MDTVLRVRVVLASTALALLAGCTGSSPDESASGPSPTSSSELPEPHLITDAPGVKTIDARPFPDWVSLAGGSAWVADVGAGIARYDARSGEYRGSVAVGTSICLAMDVGFDSLWAGRCDKTTLVRINTTNGKVVASIKLPFSQIQSESSVASGESAVFVMSRSPETIARIDPATNRVTSTFAAPRNPGALRAGYGALWVTNDDPGGVYKLDPGTGKTQSTIALPEGARFLALGMGSIWVMGKDIVSRIDPKTNKVTASIRVTPRTVGGGDIAVGGGYVWARVSDALVAQIDPKANKVTARYGPVAGSGSVAADADAVWISAHDVFSVWRLPLN